MLLKNTPLYTGNYFHTENAFKFKFRCWRERPEEFTIDGRQPVLEVFEEAKKAWKSI